MKLGYKFKEYLLGYIACGGGVPAKEVQRDRVDLVFVRIINSAKGRSFAAAAGIDDFGLGETHYQT